jgi:hypothetical protein
MDANRRYWGAKLKGVGGEESWIEKKGCFRHNDYEYRSKDTYLNKKEGSSYSAYWWNGNLSECLNHDAQFPVQHSMTIPPGNNSSKRITWIPIHEVGYEN